MNVSPFASPHKRCARIGFVFSRGTVRAGAAAELGPEGVYGGVGTA